MRRRGAAIELARARTAEKVEARATETFKVVQERASAVVGKATVVAASGVDRVAGTLTSQLTAVDTRLKLTEKVDTAITTTSKTFEKARRRCWPSLALCVDLTALS